MISTTGEFMGMHWLQADASHPARIPLPWAVSLMLLTVLPLTFYLGDWNLPLWVSFIVWAEYFALGAKLSTWKSILPSLPFGALIAALWCGSATGMGRLIESYLGPLDSLYLGYAVTNLFWVTLLVYACQWTASFRTGTLAVFNGFTLYLAVYFTGSIPSIDTIGGAYKVMAWAFVWTVALSYFGWFLGWLNIVLTFPKKP